MKPMPSADEDRRLSEVEAGKAAKLPAGEARNSHLKKARDQSSARMRMIGGDFNLHAPE